MKLGATVLIVLIHDGPGHVFFFKEEIREKMNKDTLSIKPLGKEGEPANLERCCIVIFSSNIYFHRANI